MTRHLSKFLLTLFVLISLPFVAWAQTNIEQTQAEEEKSWALAFVESQLSTPNRQIRLENIEGLLSSKASIGRITIADTQGVWLEIHDAQIDWDRTQMLRGQIVINKLAARHIEVLRRPLKEDKKFFLLESRSWSVPQLPVGVIIENLATQQLVLKKTVAGVDAVASLHGFLRLEEGALQTRFAMERLDGDGGEVTLDIDYRPHGTAVKIALNVREPQNGILANLLELPDLPAVRATIKGEGSIDLLDVDVEMETDGHPLLNGFVSLRKQEDGRHFQTQLNGAVGILVSQNYGPFLGTQFAMMARGSLPDSGGWKLDQLDIEGAYLSIHLQAAAGEDGFLHQLLLDANFVAPGDGRVALPVKDSAASFDNAALTIAYGASDSNIWTGKLIVRDLMADGWSMGDITLNMGGVAENLDDPQRRHIDFVVQGDTHDLRAQENALIAVLGETPRFLLDMSWHSGEALQVNKLDMVGENLVLDGQGSIENWFFDGQISVRAGQADMPDTSSSAELALRGQIALVGGAFNWDLQGSSHNIRTGIALIDRLLAGDVNLSGGIARDENGTYADNLVLSSENVDFTAHGKMGRNEADIEVGLSLVDLALLDARAQGGLTMKAVARGLNGVIALGLHGAMEQGGLSGRLLENVSLDFNGLLDNSLPYQSVVFGKLKGAGHFDGQTLELTSSLENENGRNRLDDFVLTLGSARISGHLVNERGKFTDGSLHLETQDISSLAALLLQEASGSLDVNIALRSEGEAQYADIVGKMRDVAWHEIKAGMLDIRFALSNVFAQPQAEGEIEGRNIEAGMVKFDHVLANSRVDNKISHMRVTGELADKGHVELEASLSAQAGGDWFLTLTRANLSEGILDVALLEPAQFHVSDGGRIDIDRFLLDVAGGHVHLKGSVDNVLAVELDVKDLPLGIADFVAPDIQMEGMVNGTVRISGMKTDPVFDFNLQGANVGVLPLTQNGIVSLAVSLEGKTQNGILEMAASLSGADSIKAQVQGRIHIASKQLDMDVDVQHLPVAIFNQRFKAQNLDGGISGYLHVGGSLQMPDIGFELMARDVSSSFLSENGLAPLESRAKGRLGKEHVVFDAFEASGPQDLNIRATGKVAFVGGAINMMLDGSAPLALANRFLAERGASAAGHLTLDATVGGSLNSPRLDGRFSVASGRFIDAQTHAGLQNIAVQGDFNGEQITLSMTAQSASGGNVSGSGTISTNIGEGMPALLHVQLDHSRYNDGSLVVATLNGAINITGPLLRDFDIGGEILVDKAEITVPSFFSDAEELEVDHKNLTPGIAATLARAKMEAVRSFEGRELGLKRPVLPRLDLVVRAPARIFVRGRGLDAELGGRIHLQGSLDDLRPTGGFNLIRGRFDILTKRLNFDEGRVGLSGTLNPELDFTASTQGNGIDVIVSLRGPFDKLSLEFSSQPEFPQDEVLSFLIFNRSISELSPLQIAQLAAAAAELTGLTQSSLMGDLRRATGLDDLDITSDGKGNTAVRAGRYIRDNIYLGLEADSQGKTKGTINLDIDQNLKFKGAVDSDSDSSLGLFYEKDY